MNTNTQPDFYQTVTDQIIAALEQGVKPWQCPWSITQASGLPSNLATCNHYQGMNIMLLWMSAQMNQFSSSQWLTFKQAKGLGGTVRKGEKGTVIFFYTMVEKTPEAGNQEEKETYPVLKTTRVFNLDQIEGLNQE
ncbi:ArdC family protein, partial [Vibrio navarrensis]